MITWTHDDGTFEEVDHQPEGAYYCTECNQYHDNPKP